jgi:cell division protein FtsI (penicillin-binding protein 3)
LLKLRAPRTQPGEFRPDRSKIVQVGVYAMFGALLARATVLHLFPSKGESLHVIADNQYLREVELAPWRGSIYDRRGDAIAISIRRPSLAVNPRIFDPSASDVTRLARLLNMPAAKIRKIAAKTSYFAWLARQVDHRIADEVQSLDLPGLSVLREPSRYYPAGNAAAHLLGFTGLDNNGLTGLERQFEKDLRGQAFRIHAGKDARGRFIYREASGAAPEKSGNSLYLTLDRVIQEIAEDELAKGVRTAQAKKGIAIVSDPHTGRILALANYPGFDPNQGRKQPIAILQNHALVDTFEPGSVTKPFIIAKALELKKTSLGEVHDCGTGRLKIGRHVIHDDHPAGNLTTAETIIRSSNICTFRIAQKLGRELTHDTLNAFGLAGTGATLGFPGESTGRIGAADKWAAVRFANISFGHGFVITALELVQAFGALANGGRVMRPMIVDRVVSSDGLVVASAPPTTLGQPITAPTARVMRQLLSRVVTDKHGTAKAAAPIDYSAGGKTGTAQKVDPGIKGYAKDKYIASFVGFTPVADPHLVIYVLIDEPGRKPYYGGKWAGPVFSGIAQRSLKYLNVAPDVETPAAAVASKAGTSKPPVVGDDKGRVAGAKVNERDDRKQQRKM